MLEAIILIIKDINVMNEELQRIRDKDYSKLD